jgi:hypothetical protein
MTIHSLNNRLTKLEKVYHPIRKAIVIMPKETQEEVIQREIIDKGMNPEDYLLDIIKIVPVKATNSYK